MAKVNRIQCTAKISPMMDEYYASMAHYDCVAWCMGPSAYEMMAAAGISSFQAESFAARIAGAHDETPYIEYGQARGVSPDMCSYAKINIGHVLMQLDGRWDLVAERYRLNPPNLIVAGNICPSMMQWAQVLGRIFDVPVFILDFPFAYDPTKERLRENAEYVRSQLERIKEFFLKCSGQKEYKWEKLREQTECCREMAFYQRNISALQQTIPAPASFIDGAVSMVPALTMKNQKAADFYKEYMEEMVERVKKGIGSLDNEKYRIMWRGNFPWFKVGWISRTLANYGALLVSGEYGMSYLGDAIRGAQMIPPDGYDLKDPLWTIAAGSVNGTYIANYDTKWKNEFVQFITQYSIDCCIIQAPHTCRPWTLTTREFAKRVDEELGIPCIVLEADHTDPAYFNDAQVETRIKALLETVDARREEQARKAAEEAAKKAAE